MATAKSPIAALLLSFIPGVGHAYLGRPFRFILYAGFCFGPIAMLIFSAFVSGYWEDGFVALTLLVSAFSWLINMIDMIVTLLSGKAPGLNPQAYASSGYGGPPYPGAMGEAAYGGDASSYGSGAGKYAYQDQAYRPSYEQQQEKIKTVLLSIIPGLGHMNMGLMQRGITLLISFVGLFVIIVFLSVIMNSGALLVFLLGLPVMWIYGMFDAIGLLHAKHRGEMIEDKSLFELLEAHIESGRKNKVLAIALSIFPGAGHLYLGQQKRGLQLMAGFLLAIFIMDNMRLSLFLFLLPLFWCFAFFDAFHQVARYERREMSDDPVLPQFAPYQRWLGLALLGFGVYYLVDQVFAAFLFRYWENSNLYRAYMQIKYMIPTALTAFLLIAAGLRLAFGGGKAAPPASPPAPERSFEAPVFGRAEGEEEPK